MRSKLDKEKRAMVALVLGDFDGPMSRLPEYNCWASMVARCKPGHFSHKNYFDRGIRTIPEWEHDFVNFITYIGPKPTKYHSLDRIDNDGNYEPGNVRWATSVQQSANRRVFSNNTSGFSSIFRSDNNKKWFVKYRGKNYGTFQYMEDAIKVRDEVREKYLRSIDL